MDRAWGVDVNHYHSVTSWDDLGRSGASIFGAKATNGLGVDPTFEQHRDGSRVFKTFDLVVYYHFPTPRGSAVAQADHLVELVSRAGGIAPNERIALDVELDPHSNWCPDVRFVNEFVQEAVRLVGDRRLFVYTSARVWSTYLKSASWPEAIATDAWLAHYGEEEPKLPVDGAGLPLWPRWTMWQDRCDFICQGVSGACDRDFWRGDREDLRAYMRPSGGETR